MELIVIATTLALSMGLGLAGALGMLSIVFSFMSRSLVQSEVRHGMGSNAAPDIDAAKSPRETLALSAQTA
jgi:hypothetical protein